MLHKAQRLLPTIHRMNFFTAFYLALALILLSFLLPLNVSANTTHATHTTDTTHTTHATVTGPVLQVSAGFNTRFRDGNWIPIQINLNNSGPDFDGTITINTPPPLGGPTNFSETAYQQPISLANGTQKQVTLYIPIDQGGQGSPANIRVNLLDANGHIVNTQVQSVSPIGQNDVFVAVLSDLNTGFSPLYSVSLPNQGGSMLIESLNASTLPNKAEVLKNFDLIILDNFTTSSLSPDQLTALQNWVNQGGSLLEAGGPEWRRTLSSLPNDLLPVTVTNTTTLPAGSELLPTVSSSQSTSAHINAAVPISVGTLTKNDGNQTQSSTILADGTTPLIVETHQGQGVVYYLAFDPALNPVTGWPGANSLWRELIVRSLGDKLLNYSTFYSKTIGFQTSGLGGLLQALLANNLPSPWLLLALLLGYLIILGPIRFLIIRWRKRRDWSWRIALASITLFSLLSYGLAVQQKGTAILSNSVSILRLSQGGTSAHVSTFVGVFVPNQGNYNVHIPGNNLVQPSDDQYNSSSSSAQTAIIQAGQNSTDVNLQGVKIWTLRSLVSEHDRQMQGGIISHLTYQNSNLSGTVTNTLGYPLSDVYILLATGYVHIANLSSGQTTQINLFMQTITPNNGNTIADQIAQNNHLNTPYWETASNGNPPQVEWQRHLAILSALSGNSNGVLYVNCGGGPCSAPAIAIAKRGTFFFSGGGPGYASPSGSDPLLINGAQATLIGWTTQHDSAQNVTINGSTPTGLQETLIQAPLNLQLSGTLNVPPSSIEGQVIDVQGTNVQNQNGIAYTMTTGGITFEFTLPNSSSLHIHSLAITEPANLAQTVGPVQSGSGPVIDANHLHVSLYNWQTDTWDTFQMKNFSFSTSNIAAYISPGGRILTQFTNEDTKIGTILFTKPSLNLQGTAP